MRIVLTLAKVFLIAYIIFENLKNHAVGLELPKRVLQEIVILPTLRPEVKIIIIELIHYLPCVISMIFKAIHRT